MKVEEFEAKLRMISDARLTQMFGLTRSEGPEIALTLILSEARRRGMDLDPSQSETFASSATTARAAEAEAQRASWTSHAPDTLDDEGDPDVGAEKSDLSTRREDGTVASESFSDPAFASAAPTADQQGSGMEGAARGSKWLDEETQAAGLPKIFRVILYLLALAGLVAAGYKFLHRG